MSKLRSGTSKTKAGPGELVRVALFWKSHCATCSPVYIILYHVTGSCKGPIERQRWPEMPFILGKPGTQYVATVTKLLNLYSGSPLVEAFCKVSNISVTNWLRYLFSSYLIKIWLSIWRHHLADLHILKTWISLERKEIFENSKWHFSSHTDYLFMF